MDSKNVLDSEIFCKVCNVKSQSLKDKPPPWTLDLFI